MEPSAGLRTSSERATRASVRGVDFGGLREDVPHGKSGRAVAVLAMILKEKNSAGLRGLLVDVSELMVAVAGEEFEAEQRIAFDFLLPAGAGNGEARLLKAAGGKHELAYRRPEERACRWRRRRCRSGAGREPGRSTRDSTARCRCPSRGKFLNGRRQTAERWRRRAARPWRFA